MSAFVPRTRLTVLIDFKSCHAYLALDAMIDLETQLGTDADWLPLNITHPQRRPAADAASDDSTSVSRSTSAGSTASSAADRGARHRRARANYYEQDLQRYARWRGLTIADVYPDIDSSPTGLGLLWLRDAAPALRRQYIQRVFTHHFGEQLGVADVRGIIDSYGADGAAFSHFATHAGRDEFNELQRALHASGYASAPSYVVDGEPFHGRQHLAMLCWLLTDRVGAPPV